MDPDCFLAIVAKPLVHQLTTIVLDLFHKCSLIRKPSENVLTCSRSLPVS